MSKKHKVKPPKRQPWERGPMEVKLMLSESEYGMLEHQAYLDNETPSEWCEHAIIEILMRIKEQEEENS